MKSILRNPFFIIPCIVFWINQYLEKSLQIYIPFVHAYLDDLLALPVVLGITLLAFRFIHPLKNAFTFSKIQTLIGLLYFSFLFEFVLPNWSTDYTADFLDLIFYGIGTLIFYRFINVSGQEI